MPHCLLQSMGWDVGFQISAKYLEDELRSTLEWVSVLLRLLFCVSSITYCLNQKERTACVVSLQRADLRNGKTGFQMLLGIRARDVNVGCSPPRKILNCQVLPFLQLYECCCVYLWDPSLGIHFSCQPMNGSPQLWPTTNLLSENEQLQSCLPVN